MKTINLLLTMVFLHSFTMAQTCQQKLGEATQAYHNGQLREVMQTLEPCIATKELDKQDKIAALKLMVNANLLLNQEDEADRYLQEFLTLNPTYELRDDDLAEFKRLYGTYDVRTKYSFGFSVGMLMPDYIIMRHQSYSGQTVEPSDFEEIPGISIGFTGEYSFVKNFFLNGSILYSQRSFKQREEILYYQEVSSYERDYYLDVPIQIRYVFNFKKVKPFIGGGYALHYLIHSKGDLDHVPLAPDFPMVIGVPELVDNYDLTDQRRT
ncbi:MAG: PorT family protein, partial [Cyclobacteriaceae bacterium]|nr:PorT family protein [Cyclobacteriaceae bacterium]